MSAMQRNDEKIHNPDMLLLDRMVILIALVVSGCGTRQPAPATEQATETPEPRPTITRAPISTASPLPPSPTPTPTLGPGDTKISSIDGMVLMFIPAGTFWMGSERGNSDQSPVHRVTLDAFWMDQTEVTNGMYTQCVANGICTPPVRTDSNTRSRYYGEVDYADYPMIFVNWERAQAYCTWAGRRLPTEAEWEYAARGKLGGATYPWGNDNPSCTLGAVNGVQYDPCSPDDTITVGSFAPNRYGLYDMAGNVWEWVADWYGPYPSGEVENPSGPASGDHRVVRGGSWYDGGVFLRVSYRGWTSLGFSTDSSGFRCASSP